MSWHRVIEAYKKKFNKNFVDSQLIFERDFVVTTIMNEFPEYDEPIIIAAVIHCTRIISQPRPSKQFFECVARVLLDYSLARLKK